MQHYLKTYKTLEKIIFYHSRGNNDSGGSDNSPFQSGTVGTCGYHSAYIISISQKVGSEKSYQFDKRLQARLGLRKQVRNVGSGCQLIPSRVVVSQGCFAQLCVNNTADQLLSGGRRCCLHTEAIVPTAVVPTTKLQLSFVAAKLFKRMISQSSYQTVQAGVSRVFKNHPSNCSYHHCGCLFVGSGKRPVFIHSDTFYPPTIMPSDALRALRRMYLPPRVSLLPCWKTLLIITRFIER